MSDDDFFSLSRKNPYWMLAWYLHFIVLLALFLTGFLGVLAFNWFF